MAVIKFVSQVEDKVTVAIEREGLETVEVTRPLPAGVLDSKESYGAYMEKYVAGLAIEFPDAPSAVNPITVETEVGEVLNPVADTPVTP